MRLLLVDDEPFALKNLMRVTKRACPNAEIFTADNADDALCIIKTEKIDVVFLDIEMPDANGIELCKRMKEFVPKLNVIFVTAFANHAAEAARQYFSGFFVKPPTVEQIREGLENLRYPLEKSEPEGLCIQCFGQFQASYNGERLKFSRRKTLELLAYLIDLRGGAADTTEICEILWYEELITDVHRSYLRNLVTDLRNVMNSIGMESFFHKEYNQYYIDPKMVKCDYYDYLDGDEKAINSYTGEYMSQYPWALMATRWKN